MSAVYPRAVKIFAPKPDASHGVWAVDVNDLQDEVAAIERLIGINALLVTPWATLTDWLVALEHQLVPIFSAGDGDLSISGNGGVPGIVHGSPSHIIHDTLIYNNPGSPDPSYMIRQYGNSSTTGISGAWGGLKNPAPGLPVYKTMTYEVAGDQYTTPAHTDIDPQGLFILPTPPAGYDTLGWYNGRNGFTVQRTAWYHLTGGVTWRTGAPDQRKLTIFGSGKALAARDMNGPISTPIEYKTLDYVGILQAGTNLTLGVSSQWAQGPRLSGVFLRDV